MAGDSLIEHYLAALDRRLATRHDRVDLVDEAADHLYSAAECWEATGVSEAEAERRALEQFGRPDLVASFMSVAPAQAGGGAAFLARSLSSLSIAAAALWLAAGAVALGALIDNGVYWETGWYGVVAVTVTVAIAVTGVTLLAMNVRASGEVDDPGRAVALIGVVGSCLALTLLWLIPLWYLLLAIMIIWTLARTLRSPAGSRVGTIAMLIVVSAIAALFLVLWVVSAFLPNGITVAALITVPLFTTFGVLAVGFADIAVRTMVRRSRLDAITA